MILGACRATEAPTGGAEGPVSGATTSASVEASTSDAVARNAIAPAAQTALAPPEPPASLSCLATHYTGHPVNDAGVWALELPDGTKVQWEDGRTKTALERIDAPDLRDMTGHAYKAGAIVPVTDEADDPGRARVEPLFRHTYGVDAHEVSRALVDVHFAGHIVRFHRRAAPALRRVAVRLDALLGSDPSL